MVDPVSMQYSDSSPEVARIRSGRYASMLSSYTLAQEAKMSLKK